MGIKGHFYLGLNLLLKSNRWPANLKIFLILFVTLMVTFRHLYMPVKAMLDSYPITNVVFTEVSSLGIGTVFNSV